MLLSKETQGFRTILITTLLFCNVLPTIARGNPAAADFVKKKWEFAANQNLIVFLPVSVQQAN